MQIAFSFAPLILFGFKEVRADKPELRQLKLVRGNTQPGLGNRGGGQRPPPEDEATVFFLSST